MNIAARRKAHIRQSIRRQNGQISPPTLSHKSSVNDSPARRFADTILSSVNSSPARSIASTLSTNLSVSAPESPSTPRRAPNPSNPLSSPSRRVTTTGTTNTQSNKRDTSLLAKNELSHYNEISRSRNLPPASPMENRKRDSWYSTSSLSSASGYKRPGGIQPPNSLQFQTNSSDGKPMNGALSCQFPPRNQGTSPRFAQLILTPGTTGQYGAIGVWPSSNGARSPLKGNARKMRTRDDKSSVCHSDFSTSFDRPSYGSVINQMKEANDETEGSCDFLRKALRILGKTVTVTVLIGALVSLPVAMLSVGVKYLHDCPAEPHIPIYLLVGGCFGLFRLMTLIWRQVRSRRFEKMDIYEHDDETGDFISSKSSKFTDIILNIFLFIWFIFGNYWVLKTWQPRYEMLLHEPSNWCDQTCYLFAFIQIMVCYFIMFVIGILICCLYCCHKYTMAFEDE